MSKQTDKLKEKTYLVSRMILNIPEFLFSQLTHMFWVNWYLLKFMIKLMYRGIKHDLSKFRPSEAIGFLKVIHNLKKSKFGDDLYKKSLLSIKTPLRNHYDFNSHHPQYYRKGIHQMSILDSIEMMADWRASLRRHKTGSMFNSFKVNKERFKFDNIEEKILKSIYNNM